MTHESAGTSTTETPTDLPTPTVLLGGLAMPESARWHQGRFWFAHWGTGEIVAVDLDGTNEVVAQGPAGLGWSIDWLPDGRLLVTGPALMRREADGTWVEHADLSGVAGHGWNEIALDPRGNIFLNGMTFDLAGGGPPQPGIIAVVTPDGSARKVAEDIAFPNGMVITPDGTTLIIAESFARRLTAFDIADDASLTNRRVWADGVGPDGICMDTDGCVWTGSAQTQGNSGRTDAPAGELLRVREGGQVLHRVQADQAVFACALGGPDGRTLAMLATDWRGFDQIDAVLAERTGYVLTTRAPAPAAQRC
jgi:sugar lactone lactonase YvrE